MRRKHLFVLILLTITTSKFLFGQENELPSLINRAIFVSPKIKMLVAKKEAKINKIPQVSNLPDPMLTFGLRNLPTSSFSFGEDPMTQKTIGLQQTFPFPGKLSAKEDVAAVDTSIIKLEIIDTENEIRKSVTKTYYDLNYFRRAIFYANESKKLLYEIKDVVGVKYSVSSATQQNLVKVQLEITKINDKIVTLKSRENSSLSILNSLILQNSYNDIKTKLIDSIKTIDITVQQLEKLAKTNRPYLKGIQLLKEKNKLKQISAEKEFYPNISLGLQYSFRNQVTATSRYLNNFFSVVLGFSLPLNYGGKTTAKVEEAVSLQKLHSEQYSTALQFLNSRFGSDLAELESIEERINLFVEGLLPQAQLNLKSALASYQVNEIDFINVIDAQDQLFKIETNLYRLKTNYLKQIADLEFLTGTSLTN